VGTEQEQLTQRVRSLLEEHFAQIRFARATELARSRRFLEAETLLVPDGQLPDGARELDLLARIAAQQRKFARARRCWQLARDKDPSNGAYESGLQAIARSEWVAEFWQRVAMTAFVVLSLVLLTWIARRS
jgi:hypothetical protein